MKPPIIHLCTAVLLLLGTTTASADECRGLLALKKGSSDLVRQLIDLVVKPDESAAVECGSLASVLERVVNTRKRGGRRLEDERPFNPSEAQADLAQAHGDPAVRRRLEQIRKDVPDGPQRLLYEAATLDEEGYYSARDLRIRELQRQLQ